MLAPATIYCEFRIPLNAPYHRSTQQENKDTDTKTKIQNHSIAYVQHVISGWHVKSGNTIYICGLYNKERDQGEGEYICSKCRLTEIEEGNWAPQTVLAAKDLPSTNLSDHIEQRLVTRMKQEREETAKFRGTELKNVACSEDKSSCSLSSQSALFAIIMF
ncbi:hypothetical protein Tco_0041558 [Tanacetum coccineum]